MTLKELIIMIIVQEIKLAEKHLILLLLFILSSLNVIRHTYFVIQRMIIKEKYMITNKSLFLVGISISYIITMIISGLKFL